MQLKSNKLAEDIANLAISTFNKKRLKGKPVIKSNGVKEWTVLAGIVAIHTSIADYSTDLIALTTGVKTLPDEHIKLSEGLLLHDCHAEILSLRAFNRFIVEQCHDENTKYVFKDEETGKFKLKKGIEFALYVSELPCGDCSLDSLEVHNTDAESWDTFTELDGGVIRGREGFGLKSRVRTKPGRRDSPLSLSKSCSDKLCLTQWKSMLNGLSSLCLDPDGFFIKWLVIPDDKFDKTALERCFHERCEGSNHKLQFLQTSFHHVWERTYEKQPPSNSCLVYIPSLNIQESIVNSVKEGYYTKSKRPRKNGQSLLCRTELLNQIIDIVDIDSSLTYLDLKSRNQHYIEIKRNAQNALGNWCQTSTDDFNI